MQGELEEGGRQETGIRQGCTLSPFLFILVLSAVMHDVEQGIRQEHPLATTPVVPCMDLEYADDTVLIARTAELANKLLAATEKEAGIYGLRLNEGKTCRLAYGSEETVRFCNGREVPRVQRTEYLGAIVDQTGDSSHELRARIAKAQAACKALRPIWAAGSLTRKLAVQVVAQCVCSGRMYGLQTMMWGVTADRRLDAAQIRILRMVLRIRTTYASTLLGENPVSNKEVGERAGVLPLSAQVQASRFKLLGHILRKDGADPMRSVAFDRFGNPRALGGVNRVGAPRIKWSEDMARRTEQAVPELGGPRGGGGQRR